MDDSVLLVFSQRGLTHFKEKFTHALPDETSLLSLPDAVAIAGFGALKITPASATGCSLQRNSGNNAVVIEQNKVFIKKDNNTATLDDNQFQANIGGATLTLTSSILASSVPITAPSFSGGGGSAAVMTSGIDMSGQSIANAKEVTAGGKKLSSHTHTGNQGSPTSPPN